MTIAYYNHKLIQMYRDVSIPINSNLGARLFEYAEKSGIPFEIHYEVEDTLLSPLEEMLSRYPKAKVIWDKSGMATGPKNIIPAL